MPREAGFSQALCADMQVSSPHVALRCDAARQVVLKLKTAWRDGTTHLMMSPLEFVKWLAALFHARADLPLVVCKTGLANGCFRATNSAQWMSRKGRSRTFGAQS